MKKIIYLTALILPCLNTLAQLPAKVHLGLLYPLSTNGTHAPSDTNTLSIHLISGISAAEHGLTVSGFSNIIRKEAAGTQIAGFLNLISGKAEGTQLAGFANVYRSGQHVALAGFSNLAYGDVKGAQLAGFMNVARDVQGPQFAGFMNLARNIKGPQFAGFLNVAKKVKGVQASGFINVADSSDYPIGLINLIKNGRKGIGVSIDETQTALLTFRSGGKVLYGIAGIGYNRQNTDEVYAMELGFGARFFPHTPLGLNAEITAQTLESFKSGEYFKAAFRLMPELTLFRTISFYGGPSFHLVATNTTEGKRLHPRTLHRWKNRYSADYTAIYVGYQAGFQLLF